MKIGVRKPSIKKSVKSRTTGKAKRQIKSTLNPTYGKKELDWRKTLKNLLKIKYIKKHQ